MNPPSLLGVSARVETDSYFGARLRAKRIAKRVVTATKIATSSRLLQIARTTSRNSISSLLGSRQASSSSLSRLYPLLPAALQAAVRQGVRTQFATRGPSSLRRTRHCARAGRREDP